MVLSHLYNSASLGSDDIPSITLYLLGVNLPLLPTKLFKFSPQQAIFPNDLKTLLICLTLDIGTVRPINNASPISNLFETITHKQSAWYGFQEPRSWDTFQLDFFKSRTSAAWSWAVCSHCLILFFRGIWESKTRNVIGQILYLWFKEITS